MKARALHEGDALAFIDELARSSRGLYPVDRCTLKRVADGGAVDLRVRVEADCALEWITLREKKGAGRAS
jgi:hypothetical protein